jgi:hypothetical protein
MADYQKGEYQAEIYLLMELTIQYGCDGLLFFYYDSVGYKEVQSVEE